MRVAPIICPCCGALHEREWGKLDPVLKDRLQRILAATPKLPFKTRTQQQYEFAQRLKKRHE